MKFTCSRVELNARAHCTVCVVYILWSWRPRSQALAPGRSRARGESWPCPVRLLVLGGLLFSLHNFLRSWVWGLLEVTAVKLGPRSLNFSPLWFEEPRKMWFPHLKTRSQEPEMPQWVKTFVANDINLATFMKSTPETHAVEGEDQLPKSVLWPPHTSKGTTPII